MSNRPGLYKSILTPKNTNVETKDDSTQNNQSAPDEIIQQPIQPLSTGILIDKTDATLDGIKYTITKEHGRICVLFNETQTQGDQYAILGGRKSRRRGKRKSNKLRRKLRRKSRRLKRKKSKKKK